MEIYFVKHSTTGNIYTINDFYNGTNFRLNNDYKLNLNFKADNRTTVTIPPTISFDVRNFTHAIVPSLNMIYMIMRYPYLNNDQFQIDLEEDAMISNYFEMLTKDMYLNRSSHSTLFTGIHDIKDTAIKHIATNSITTVAENYTGLWALYTFQKTSNDIVFNLKDLDNIPYVQGEFVDIDDITDLYPDDDPSIINPFNVDYYLKFAKLNNGTLYQCVWRSDTLLWTEVQKEAPQFLTISTSTITRQSSASNDSVIVLTGDVDTINVAFPLDCTVATLQSYYESIPDASRDVFTSIPSFYHVKSFTQSDALISIKIVPEELILEPSAIQDNSDNKLERYNLNPFAAIETSKTYYIKQMINNLYSKIDGGVVLNVSYNFNTISVKQFKNDFAFDYTSQFAVNATDPFKKYYLSFYGEIIEIPSKYLKFNVRIAVTSTDVIYEVYTDFKYNVIGSGRLPWFTRYAIDQLDLFIANNPTYKEQFWTNQISGAIRGVGLGALGGALNGRPIGVGAGVGAASSILTTATGMMNMHFMEKGLRDKADQIFGQNDLSMSLIKGFGVYLITITPESAVLNQMLDTLSLIGFPVGKIVKLNTILESRMIVAGKMLETVKNHYVTNEINKKILEGIVIIR